MLHTCCFVRGDVVLLTEAVGCGDVSTVQNQNSSNNPVNIGRGVEYLVAGEVSKGLVAGDICMRIVIIRQAEV